jgi:hypothetical protein
VLIPDFHQCRRAGSAHYLLCHYRARYVSRYCHRLINILLTCICACDFNGFTGSIYKSKFSAQIPNLSYCTTVVPYGYGYPKYSNSSDFSKYQLTRPPQAVRDIYDAKCDAVNTGSFYAVMAQGETEFLSPLVTYNISNCVWTAGDDVNGEVGNGDGLCPFPTTQRDSEFCPCVSVSSTETCREYTCYDDNTNTKCGTYEASVVGACYCFDFLINMISTEGVTATINYIKSAKSDACYPFFLNYSKATAITYGTTVVTVLINYILKLCLKILVPYECHADVDKAQASLMFKTFVATFFNMAVVVLIAFGRIETAPEALQEASIFQGIYPDFTSAWYGVVGAYLVLTFAIQVITAPVGDLINYLLVKPLYRCFAYPHIR